MNAVDRTRRRYSLRMMSHIFWKDIFILTAKGDWMRGKRDERVYAVATDCFCRRSASASPTVSTKISFRGGATRS